MGAARNGDGLDDVLVGAPGDDGFGSNAGKAYVFSGLDGALLHAHEGHRDPSGASGSNLPNGLRVTFCR